MGGGASVLDAMAAALGGLARRDQPLGARTTYRVGGNAALWVEVVGVDTLDRVHDALVSVGEPVPVLVVGLGSNLLVADAGFPGVAMSLGQAFGGVEIDGVSVRAGAAAGMPVVARRSAAAGLRGLEWAVGVPGSVGGALRMNAGGHGAATAEVLSGYAVYDLGTGVRKDHSAAEFDGRYRRSSLGPAQVALGADFSLKQGDASEAQAAIADVVRWRRQHQPGGSNAGSVFTNPEGEAAGALVERCGLKGRRMGTAQVSPKHANFIQADDGGSADDVRRLIDLVRAEVLEQTGVALVPELHMVGFTDSPAPIVGASQPSTSTGGGG